jgi:hypothetical protein
MKSFKPWVLLFCAILAAVGFTSPAWAAKPEDVFAFDSETQDWVLKSGGEAEGAPRGGQIDEGLWFYVVNPDADDAAKGLDSGILLYDAKGKKYSFLPLDEEHIGVENVFFSPDKKRIVVVSRMSRFFSGISVYDNETLELENTFNGYSDVWFVDDVRFAFTLTDENIERPEAAGLWGTSAAIYDPAQDKGCVILKGATATESFIVIGASETEITVNVTSVKSSKDWKDVDKQQETEITVEVPAAG